MKRRTYSDVSKGTAVAEESKLGRLWESRKKRMMSESRVSTTAVRPNKKGTNRSYGADIHGGIQLRGTRR